MEGTSIIRLFQNADNIFKQFSIAINKIITNDDQKKKKIKDHTMRYIEICTLFDSFFSLSRTLTEETTQEIIEKLEIVIDKTMTCWRNL